MSQTGKTKKSKETPLRSTPKKDDPDLRLWAAHGAEDVYFQREAQVNFWTVLGGLAMAALLTQLSPLLQEIQRSRWYLLCYLFASILIVAISWVETSWGSLVLKWPIAVFTSVTMLFQMLSQSIQCLLITNPSGWLLATAGIILFALLNQVYFEKSGAWKIFSPESIKRFRVTNGLYAAFMFLCLAGAFQLYWVPSQLAEMIWGVVILILTIITLYMQHSGMQQEKREFGIP
jgi:hypothetical protein